MNWDQIQGDWKEFRGKVKEKWTKLTDNERPTIAEQREQLIGSLQEMYGYDKEQAEQELYEFTHGRNSHAATADMRRPR